MKLTPKACFPSLVSLKVTTIQHLFQCVVFSWLERKVAVKSLRDTGAKHCFLFDSVLPDFSVADTGDFIVNA